LAATRIGIGSCFHTFELKNTERDKVVVLDNKKVNISRGKGENTVVRRQNAGARITPFIYKAISGFRLSPE
jgi:hypothetical protein